MTSGTENVCVFLCWTEHAFSSCIRDNFEDKEVVRLEYEAYESMALKEMEKLCLNTRKEHPAITHVVVHHRLGTPPVLPCKYRF